MTVYFTDDFIQLIVSEQAVRMEHVNRRQEVNEGSLETSSSVADPDKGNSCMKIAQSLKVIFLKLYDFSFLDSFLHLKLADARLVCNSRHLTLEQEHMLLHIFQAFAADVYNRKGDLHIERKDGPEKMYSLYQSLSNVPLFLSENARGQLLVEIGRGAKWHSLFPSGVDFSRGIPDTDISQRFQDAFFAETAVSSSPSFVSPPEHVLTMAGTRFLYFTTPDGQHHLIAETGHLIALNENVNARLLQHIAARKSIDDFKVPICKGGEHATPHLSQYLIFPDETKNPRTPILEQLTVTLLRMKTADAVDGKQLETLNDGHRHVALACMDIDVLTGLRLFCLLGEDQSELDVFQDCLKSQGIDGFAGLLPEGAAAPETCRAHVHAILEQVKARADFALRDIITRAQTRLESTLPLARAISDKAFENEQRKPFAAPRMYMTQGPTGVGKGRLRKFAESECGEHGLVATSFDKARLETDRFWLYLATDNHNDDYKSVETFARTIRNLTVRRARQARQHLFIDGSGIPYMRGNDGIVRAFKERGYQVSILGAHAPLFLIDRKDAVADSVERWNKRLREEKWAVPIAAAATKHFGHPIASRNAARDPNVDRFIMMDFSGPVGSEYTLSYVLPEVNAETLERIAPLDGDDLFQALHAQEYIPDYVKLPSGGCLRMALKILRANEDGTYRLEIITDLHHYIHLVQKGLFNRNATGPEGWYENHVQCDVEGRFKGADGMLKLFVAT